MNAVGKLFLFLTLTLIFRSPTFCLASESESFVDKAIYETLPFEEDPADKFIAEKQEINRLCTVENISEVDAGLHELYLKLQELEKKEVIAYGEKYVDWDRAFAANRLLSWSWERDFIINFQQKLSGRSGEELKNLLQDEKTWKEFQDYADKKTQGFSFPLELSFRINQQFANLCEETLGEDAPITLKHKINLAQDYSLLGDSKTALEMETKLLPKIEKSFGKKSVEVAKLLKLMANDFKTLGNYKKSEETLLKLISLNKELHGEENSAELVSNFVALINLRKATPNSDGELYNALEKAAKNLSEDDLYRLGYFRAKILNNPVHNVKKLVDLEQVCTKERSLIKNYRNDDYIKAVDMFFEQAETAELLGLHQSTLTDDLLALITCKLDLGSNHHKTLISICNLSDDYLRLNKIDNALNLAEKAYNQSKKIYGDNHPCTIYAIHSLTNVYRKSGEFSKALENDLAAQELCKKIFIKNSANEPQEILTVLADIADDYKGLKNYSSAIKYYEKFLSQGVSENANNFKVAEVRKNLANLYNIVGDYEKTLKLYDFLKDKDNFYSLNDGVGGLVAAHTADALGDALKIAEKNDAAAKIYSEEIKKLEEVRYYNTYATGETENKLNWFAETVDYYKKAAAFFVSRNKDFEAFRAVELCKGRILADQYNDLLAIHKGNLNAEDISKLNDYKRKISWYEDNFSEGLKNGSDSLKFNLGVTQLTMTQEYNGFKKLLQKKYPQYAEILKSGRIDTGFSSEHFFNSEQIKSLIAENDCYISFSVAKKNENLNTSANEILVFVADENGSVKSFSIAADDEFFTSCNIYRELLEYQNLGQMENKFLWKLSDGNYKITKTRQKPNGAVPINSEEDFEDAKKILSEKLGDKLLSPLAEFISDKKTWIISPDGELNNIPFETLLFKNKMAIESVNISYVPSLAILKLMKETGEKNNQLQNRKELFAMGNAFYGNNYNSKTRSLKTEIFQSIKSQYSNSSLDLTKIEWSDLANTAEELNQVSNIFSKTSQEILSGRDASEKNLKQRDETGELSKYRYVVLAAHGIFIPERPEWSSIVLSQKLNDKNYDGYVTVGEWFGYKLNSDLIYLSACESGLGEYQSGEGIIGIPYALTVAGNKDTVMSLWEVYDVTTSKFVPTFFKKLREGKSEVQALSETKREFIKNPNPKFSNPSAWAAFLLYGI